ncbi:hypothetical protein DYI37_02865 [Fulvimarina endophytica]|uniref:Uncharacterized protein n=1 Tax=Fulvimarina endophytica TaxID=2293836 RepID=A0A371XB10_9HYPH|nr:hypothetical protein [Fulvimarina endophytica]RFC66400.1 hypothetical protein DYI37_02865 [Fulvimarina endophytica]
METRLTTAIEAIEAGDWDKAHEIVQADCSREAAWIHAHLHRIEGDQTNANYWYNRANRPKNFGTIEEERAEIKRGLSN